MDSEAGDEGFVSGFAGVACAVAVNKRVSSCPWINARDLFRSSAVRRRCAAFSMSSGRL